MQPRTLLLSAEQVRYIDELIARGAYASAADVVGAGLLALRERDTAIEAWLLDEVAAAFDAHDADPGSAIPADQVFGEIRARHAERLKTEPRGP